MIDRRVEECAVRLRSRWPGHRFSEFRSLFPATLDNPLLGNPTPAASYTITLERVTPENRCFGYALELTLDVERCRVWYSVDEMPVSECDNQLAQGEFTGLKSTGDVLEAVDQACRKFEGCG